MLGKRFDRVAARQRSDSDPLRDGTTIAELHRRLMTFGGAAMWIVVAVVLVLVPVDAEAYIDPGVASYVFQAIAGAALGAVFLVRTYWGRLKATLRNRLTSDKPENV